MGSVPSAFAFLLMIVVGWVNRHQLIVIEYLQAENRLLKERLRGKRIRFTDGERALLARKAKAVGRKALLKIFIGQASLRRAVSEFMEHYHAERNHQGLDNRLIRGHPTAVDDNGIVQRRQRLGGMLNFYYRKAA